MTSALIPVLLGAVSATAAVRVSAGNVEVIGESGEQAARAALQAFHEARAAMAAVAGRPVDPLPVRIWLFADGKEFERVRPDPAARGFFQSGADRDHIGLAARTPDFRRVVRHEAVHLALHHTSRRRPAWLEEGLAEFYSTVAESKGRLRAGAVIPGHERVLAGAIAPAIVRFYSESWALVRMLLLHPKYRPHFPKFLQAMDDSTDPDTAFVQAFGEPIDSARRVSRGLTFGTVDLAPAPRPLEATADTPSGAMLDALRSELYLSLGLRWERPEPTEISDAEAATHSGLLALRQGNDRGAEQSFRQAVALGAVAATPYFELAALLRDRGAPAGEVRELLAGAIERNPGHSEALYLLGKMAFDDGRDDVAARHLEAAVAVSPRQTTYWYLLSQVRRRRGDAAGAREAALRARDTSVREDQRDMAAAELSRSEDSPVKGTLRPPPPPNLGDTAEGEITDVDCLGSGARLTLRRHGEEWTAWIRDPARIRSSGFAFECGVQSPPAPVRVRFRQENGESIITAIDSLP